METQLNAGAGRWLLVATLVVYLLPGLFPDPSWAQYVMRGILGVTFAWALWRGVRIPAAIAAVIAVFEGATTVCGSLYPVSLSAFEALCDKGTGLPLTLPALTGALVAAVVTIRPSNRAKQGQ